MNRIWFTSDTHFNHVNIIPYCHRPYTNTTEMNEDMIARWNAKVEPGDTVYHLGDFALGPRDMQPPIFRRLNGNIHLILGNHDRSKSFYTENDLVAEVASQAYVIFGGYTFWLAHIPSCNDLDKRGLKRPKPTQAYDYELCGHVHDAWKVRTSPLNGRRVLNVGADVWNLQPINMGDIFDALHLPRI